MQDTRDVDLIACYWTLAGPYEFGDHDHSPWDLRERAAAARRAGYRGIGIKQADLRRTRDRYGYGGIRNLLEDQGLVHLELEVLMDWFASGRRRERSDRDRHDLLEAAAELGARHIKVCGDFRKPGAPIGQLHDEFQRLVDQSRPTGAVLALEYLPLSSNVNSLASALEVLGESAGRGAGVMLDLWHVARTGTPLTEVVRLSAGQIAGAELADGTFEVVVSELADTLNERRLPGQGEFDGCAFVEAVFATGYRGPIGVEIISAEQRARPLIDAARCSFAAARAVVTAALGH
jgi:sugar phosphate isomerase/epimerase